MRTFLSCVMTVTFGLALSLTLGGPAMAGDLDGRVLALQGASADYEISLTALVDDAAVPDTALAQLASSADWRLRHQASVALGWRQQSELYTQLAGMQPIQTRAGTLRFSGEFRAQSVAAPALLDRYLHSGEDAGTRAALVEALFFTGGDWGQALSELIDAEPSLDVQVMMVTGLRDAEGTWALPALTDALDHAQPAIRAEAASSAGWRADAATDDALTGALLIALADTDEVTRANAARSLGVLGIDSAVTSLEALLTDDFADARLNALRAIERIDADTAASLPQLSTLKQDSDARVARLATKLSS